jgi:hypothetical protein
MPVLLPHGGSRGQNGHGCGRGRNCGRIGGCGHGGRVGPHPSREQPKALPLLPIMSCRNKQGDLPLSHGRGMMIKARHPLLIFSRVSLLLDNDVTVFVFVVVLAGPCRQDRGEGEEATTLADAPAATHRGGGHCGNQIFLLPLPRL